ncbi:MAG: hypothetical protein KBC36_12950 [Spirochaetia bacterium]|nr:hypothetical protein [Spirochaetia bacterium]
MRKTIAFVLLVALAVSAAAQDWTLKDLGVGLVVEDAAYAERLTVAERGSSFDAKALYENGALAGTYRGNQRFAAWIQGPPSDHPAWYWSCVVRFPDGKTAEFGPYGFYAAGHGTLAIPVGGYTEGAWELRFSIRHRDTKEVRSVGTVKFTTTWGSPTAAATPGWKLLDSGVGIYDQTNYDTVLAPVERGESWSRSRLYEKGYFANRSLVFGAWLKGPPTKDYLDPGGMPIWLYGFTLTEPGKAPVDFGPYNFYAPGFATAFINCASGSLGAWKLDWFLVNRASGQRFPVKTLGFTLTE